MRICHICSGHTVDDTRVFHKMCLSLATLGYDVHLIAQGEGPEEYECKGVKIHTLTAPQSRMSRISRRFRIAELASSLKPDLFHVHEPELLGPVIRCAGHQPVVWDVHESYLDVLMAREWIPTPLRRLARIAWDIRERSLLHRCAGVVVVTERIATRYQRLHKNVVVVANFPDLVQEARGPKVPGKDNTCVFTGGLTSDRGLLELVRSFGILKTLGIRVSLELAGSINSKEYFDDVMKEARRLQVHDWIHYHGAISRSEAISLQSSASIGVIPYLPTPNSMASLPNKLLECMAVGIPVIFSNFANYRAVAEKCEAGIAIDPTKPEQIANAIARLVLDPNLRSRMGANGARAVTDRFNWGIEGQKLFSLYEQILAVHIDKS
jgi:glycosyltransferase involved in cell wall biosynthesis